MRQRDAQRRAKRGAQAPGQRTAARRLLRRVSPQLWQLLVVLAYDLTNFTRGEPPEAITFRRGVADDFAWFTHAVASSACTLAFRSLSLVIHWRARRLISFANYGCASSK